MGRGVSAKLEWSKVHPEGGWNVCLLSRCFTGLCLSRGCDMVSGGQLWDYREEML